MRKQRDIFYGIVVYICIIVLINLFNGLNAVFIQSTSIPPLFYQVGEIILYAAILYFLFSEKKCDKTPITWWFSAFIIICKLLVIPSINYQLTECLSMEICTHIATLGDSIIFHLFILCLIIFSHRQYHKNKDYTYYGFIIIIIINSALLSLYSLLKIFTLYPQSSYPDFFVIASFFLIIPVFYFIFYIVRRRPQIPILLPIILFITPFIIKSYPNITLLLPATQSADSLIATTMGSVCIAAIILTVYLISYIEYYLIRRNIRWIEYFNTDFIPKALTIGAIFITSLALTYISFQIINSSNIKKEYQSALEFAPNSLITHFPAKTDNFQVEIQENSPIRVITAVKKGKKAVQECLRTLIQTKVLRIYEASDPNLILIGKDRKIKDEIDSINKNGINYYPIYYDNSLFQHHSKSNSSESTIPEDFKIYIIDAQPGVHSDKATNNKLSFLPKVWENGYSRGVYLSEKQKTAIYWLAIW